jgi:hypothetical protein
MILPRWCGIVCCWAQLSHASAKASTDIPRLSRTNFNLPRAKNDKQLHGNDLQMTATTHICIMRRHNLWDRRLENAR